MKLKKSYQYLLVFLISYFLLSANMGGVSIFSYDEAKNAGCAIEMKRSGEMIIPSFGHELRTDKPPLHYYFMMAAYEVFGYGERGARFFSALFGALTVTILYHFVFLFASGGAAIFTTLVLLSSLHFIFQFHMSVPDPYLIFFMTLGLFTFFAFYKNRKPGNLYLMYIAFSLGVLSKGPVAILLPGLSVFIFLITRKQFTWTRLKSFRPLQGIVIIALLVLPWYILVGKNTAGHFNQEFFIEHNLERFLSPMEGHGGPFFLTLLYVVVGMLPFSVFIVQMLGKIWKDKDDDLILFSIIVSIVIVAFFMISGTKLPNYTVPAYPFIAFLFGYYFNDRLGKQYINKRHKTSYFILIFISLALLAGTWFGLQMHPVLNTYQWIALTFLPALVGSIIALHYFNRHFPFRSMFAIGLSFIITSLMFFYISLPLIDRHNPKQELIHHLKNVEKVLIYKNTDPAIIFYLNAMGIEYRQMENAGSLFAYANSQHNIRILSKKKYYEKELSKLDGFRVLKVHPNLFENFSSIVIEPVNTAPSLSTHQ